MTTILLPAIYIPNIEKPDIGREVTILTIQITAREFWATVVFIDKDGSLGQAPIGHFRVLRKEMK